MSATGIEKGAEAGPNPVAVEIPAASLAASDGGSSSFRRLSRRLSIRATDDTMKVLLRYNIVEYLYQKSSLFKIVFCVVTFGLAFNLALNACLDVNVATSALSSPYWYNVAIVHPLNCNPSYYQANNTQYMMGEWLLMVDRGLCPQELATKRSVFSYWKYEGCIAWGDSATWSSIDKANSAIGVSSNFLQGATESSGAFSLLTASCVFAFFIWIVSYIYSKLVKEVYVPASKVAYARSLALVLLVFSLIEFATAMAALEAYSGLPQFSEAPAWGVYFPTCDVYTRAGSGLGVLRYVAVTSGMLMVYCILFFANTFWVFIYDLTLAPFSADAVANAHAQYSTQEVVTVSPLGDKSDSLNRV